MNANPIQRLAAMQAIEGSLGGWARLYGTKDLTQFQQQIAFMQDFADNYSKRDIPFSDAVPTYADMNQAQLRYYFTWREKVRQGCWENIGFSYALLYLFELLNMPGNAAKLAEAWLELHAFHLKLGSRMHTWFKDYCLCYGLDFWAQVDANGLAEFYKIPRGKSVSDIASYDCRSGRFFREKPELLPLFERMLEALAHNLESLLAFYGLKSRAVFYPKPVRFAHYELFQGAAVVANELPNPVEIQVSHNEIYRYRAGKWGRAAGSAFRLPSHAAGWLVKRAEAALRDCEGFRTPWSDPQAQSLLERWLHEQPQNANLFALTQDVRLEQIITQTVQAIYQNKLKQGELCQLAVQLEQRLRQEPYKTIRALQKKPRFAAYSMDQLSDYLAWKERLHAGSPCYIETRLALLYLDECKDIDDLCRFLRDYGLLDKIVARKLRELIPLQSDLLKQWKLEAWYPALFLFGESDQFEMFLRLSNYKLQKSRFYALQGEALFRACFEESLCAVKQAFARAGFELPKLMRSQGELTPFAAAFAGFLLKRIEQQLRTLAHFPRPLSADSARMLEPATKHQSKLNSFVSASVLTNAIDQAVEQAAMGKIKPAGANNNIRLQEALLPELQKEPMSVTINFARLDHIRRQADELTELLLVEEDATETAATSKQPEPERPDAQVSLVQTLSQEQVQLIDALIAGQGLPIDEVSMEAINDIALDVMGDTLIESGAVVEDYKQAWKEGTL